LNLLLHIHQDLLNYHLEKDYHLQHQDKHQLHHLHHLYYLQQIHHILQVILEGDLREEYFLRLQLEQILQDQLLTHLPRLHLLLLLLGKSLYFYHLYHLH
tara:strand:+ start:347 stop:646 length:300 start_codon:yes stop_codon:yes gene_type:complete